MKNLFLIIILIQTAFVFSQNSFCIDVTKDISMLHNRYQSFRSDTLSINTGAIGACVSYSITPDNSFHFETFLQFSIISDKSDMINLDGRSNYKTEALNIAYSGDVYIDSYSFNQVIANSSSVATGFNLYKRVSKYFSIGGGFHFTFIKSQYTELLFSDYYAYSNDEYILAARGLEEKKHELFKFNPTFPIVVRGYLPIKNNTALRLSIYGHIAQQARLSCALGFCF